MTDQTNTMLCLVIAASVLSFAACGVALFWWRRWATLEHAKQLAAEKRHYAAKHARAVQIARHRELVAQTTAKLRMEIAA